MDGPWAMQYQEDENGETVLDDDNNPIVDQDKLNRYQYNGKELISDLGLNWNDYGARWYDPAIGRWNAVDPAANEYTSWSPYHYTYDNPIKFIDPTGAYIEEGSQNEWNRRTGQVIDRRNQLQSTINSFKAKAEEKGWSNEKLAKKLGNLEGRVARLNETIAGFSLLEISQQGYSLSTGAGEVGGTTYDPSTGNVVISFGSTANFVHEVTHAGHFETGDIAFSGDNGSTYAQDLDDEVDSYQAQFAYDPSSVSGLSSTSRAKSFSGITRAWVQGITTSTGNQPYAPGGSSNTGVTPLNINSTRADFIRAYPNNSQLRNLPANFNLMSIPNIKVNPFLPGWYAR